MRRLVGRLGDDDGATAIEFAILAPVFLMLVVGTIYLCIGLFMVGSLNFAVQKSARCAAVQSTVCTDSASTIAYAKKSYFGPKPIPTFTYAEKACGKNVSGSDSFVLELVMTKVTVPIHATACFP